MKMNKQLTALILLLFFFSCQKNVEDIDIANILRGNTFELTFQDEKDSVNIEFQDSTFIEFSEAYLFDDKYNDLIWKTKTIDNNYFLILNSKTIKLKERDKNTFDGILFAEKDYKITLKKREPKWDVNLLFGKWIEKEQYEYRKNDSLFKPPHPPLPAPPKNLTETDFIEQPIFEISKDSIIVKYDYNKSIAPIKINNSNEFLTTEVKSNFGIMELQWKIKKLTDSTMIIDKIIADKNNEYFQYEIKTIENIELIKIN